MRCTCLSRPSLPRFFFLAGQPIEHSLRLGYREKHVVEIALDDVRPHVARTVFPAARVGYDPAEEIPRGGLERGVVAEREDAGLVAQTLVCQEIGIV